ncbi:unnamed protein product, partial [marine sediment metagenome]
MKNKGHVLEVDVDGDKRSSKEYDITIEGQKFLAHH